MTSIVDAATEPTRPPSFLDQLRGLAPAVLQLAPLGVGVGMIPPAIVSGAFDTRDWEQRKAQLESTMGTADAASAAVSEAQKVAQEVASSVPPSSAEGGTQKSGYLGVDDMLAAKAAAPVVGNDGVTRYYVNTKDGAREVLYKDSDAYTTLAQMGNKERLQWRKSMWLGASTSLSHSLDLSPWTTLR